MKKMNICKECGGGKTDFGTLTNKVVVKMPNHWATSKESRYINLDSCMVAEMKKLWERGIRTIECCCGHGCTVGYICVDKKSIGKMEELGYINGPRIHRDDMFLPKGASNG